MILAVTGSRRFHDRALVFAALDALIPAGAFLHLGDATGVDAFARAWAEQYAPDRFRMFKADWYGYGKAAGPMRNARMINGADRLIAFLEGAGPGTRDCIAQAERLRIPVVRVPAAQEARTAEGPAQEAPPSPTTPEEAAEAGRRAAYVLRLFRGLAEDDAQAEQAEAEAAKEAEERWRRR